MKASYCFPSGNYNVLLSKEELAQLLEKGHITIHMSRVPCVTSRAVWNPKKKDMDILDKKSIFNDLRFRTTEPVADMEPGDNNVQFMCISIEKDKNGGSDGTKENYDGSDRHYEL